MLVEEEWGEHKGDIDMKRNKETSDLRECCVFAAASPLDAFLSEPGHHTTRGDFSASP